MKKSLVFALALMMVLAFATSAFAAQAIGNIVSDPTNTTVVGGVYYTYTPTVKTFTPDGTTQYPYEIYLPNESADSYKIHSSYTKNTDACASCHSVHTAVNEYLLQWYTTYDTCMACHDGTVSTTYDVARGVTGEDLLYAGNTKPVPAAGGMFGYTGAEASLSKHNVTGEITNAGAPGGGVVSDTKGTGWESEFSCDGCHDPHGVGGNARLLKGDVNGAATQLAVANNFNADPTLGASNGVPASATLTVGSATAPAWAYAGTAPAIASAVYKYGVVGGTDYTGKTAYVARPDSLDDAVVYNGLTSYTLANVPPYMFSTSVKVYTLSGATWSESTSKFFIDNQLGYTRAIWTDAAAAPAYTAVKFCGVPQIKVVFKINNYLNSGGVPERVYHISGLNPFCGGCHTDYNTASYEVYNIKAAAGTILSFRDGKWSTSMSSRLYDTGAYSKAHRHTVARSGNTAPGMAEGMEYPLINVTGSYSTTNLSCLGCHVAHGAGTDWWNNYLVDRGIKGIAGDLWTTAQTTEIAGSSALKRMPNMGVCMNCHNMQGSQVGYAANSGQTAFVNTTSAAAALATQATATYVGGSQCFRCHKEEVGEWVETQHNMFAPLDNELAGNYLVAFDPNTGLGNSTAESIELLDELGALLKGEDGPIEPLATNGGITAGTEFDNVLDAVKAITGKSTLYANVTYKDIFTVGQLPVGTRSTLDCTRELIVRAWDGTKYVYEVAAVLIYNNTLNEWEIEEFEAQNDGYAGSCFNCHASLTSCDASATGSATVAGKNNNRQLLNQWMDYLYNDGGRPGRDFGISCEACHGQASSHVANPSPANITNPSKLSMEAQSMICGRCHVGSGNRNALSTQYSVWKLDNPTAITAGSVKDTVYAGPYTGIFWTYDTYGEQMDALFSASWESFTDAANTVLPAANYADSSAYEWTYKSKEGRVWTRAGHDQYTALAVSKHFDDGAVVSCVTCHASHGANESGVQAKYQLKKTVAGTCSTCHGTQAPVGATAEEYMPTMANSEVNMHDFGRVFDADTQETLNTQILPADYPVFE